MRKVVAAELTVIGPLAICPTDLAKPSFSAFGSPPRAVSGVALLMTGMKSIRPDVLPTQVNSIFSEDMVLG